MNRIQIEKLVQEKILEANNKFGLSLAIPEVVYMNRKRLSGSANSKLHRLSFNETLAAHNSDKFHETVIHEVAHLVHRKLYPLDKTAHNKRFYSIDIALGGRGTRCHSYDTTVTGKVRTLTRYLCTCPCGNEFKVTQKVASRANKYWCRTCKGKLTYTGQVLKVVK